ncbi:MAG: thioesterase family protein [Alphaproteobacteria bacterium]|nr:thioesterase family protein [Alphaproteobacteria bacterium]
MIPLWSGIPNTWDCDEMGHMNVRVYVEKAMEGLGNFAGAVQMPHAFRANAPSTLMVAEHHIRYIREAHAGHPLRMTGCVLEWDETSALIYQEMRHGDGRAAAAFRTRVVHVEAKTGKPFPWSTRSQAQLEALIESPPDDTKPRGLDPSTAPVPPSMATMAAVEKCGAPEIGRGLFQTRETDIFSRVAAPWFIGRISDSVPTLLYDWRSKVAASKTGARMGGAVLEYRLIYRKWPRAGDRYVVHTSLANVAEKTHSLSHWILDPDTGDAWITSEAVAVTFDLDTRKAIPTPPEQIAELEKLAPRGLRL